MYQNIMDSPSAMSNFRNRNGLNHTKGTQVTQLFLEKQEMQKRVRYEWNRIKNYFERTYSNCKTYDFFYIKSFVEDIPTMTPVLYRKIANAMNQNDLENYLLKRMYINKQQLNLRNTKLTDY